jgi:DNA-binding NtrC family response regulator
MLIFIIGSVSLDDAVNAINQGADAYIMRPVNLEKLLKMVREKLDKKRRKNVKKR